MGGEQARRGCHTATVPRPPFDRSQGRATRCSVPGGFAVVDVPSRQEALEWAAKIAAACRCAQEVWELLDDPTV
jgi:hypothetical protein